MFELRPRLKAAADMVTPGCTVADIGTDHAYLPAYLLLNGISPFVIACDIGKLPLENAAATAERFGLADKISLRVADGLEKIAPGEANEITVCGMGGTLIADILGRAKCLGNDVHLVLQPMTHAEDVRTFLCKNGFLIDREVCVRDDGRVYCCMSARRFDGAMSDEPGFRYFGTLTGATDAERVYIRKTADRVRIRERSIRAAGRFPDEQELLRGVLRYYERMYDGDVRKRYI